MAARTVMTPTTITASGVALSLAAVDSANGNYFANDGRTFVQVANAAGAPITVTVDTPGTVNDLAIAQLTVTVTNGTTKLIGPFPPGTYNQTGDVVNIDWSSGTSITAQVLRI